MTSDVDKCVNMVTLLTDADKALEKMLVAVVEEVNIHHDILEELVDEMGMQIVIKGKDASLVPQKPINKKGKK